MAQLAELGGKAVTVGGAVADFEPDTWYFLHQRRVVNDNKVEHSEVGELPMGAGFMHDEGEGQKVFSRSIDNVPDNSSTTAAAGYLVRFIASDEHDGAYLMQFGTGNYLNIPDGAGNSSSLYTTASIYDASEIVVYKIEETDGHFAMNLYDANAEENMGVGIDNTGVDYRIPIWGSGRFTNIDGNRDWSFHSVIFSELSDRDQAEQELMDILAEYREYLGNLPIGTNPGEYDADKVEAFEAALNAADVDNPDVNIDDMTTEQIRQLIQNIKDTYEAALASKKPMVLPDGYYRLKTGMRYITSEEDPETLEPIESEVDKYMTYALNGSTINVRWGSSDDLSTDATVLWQVTNLAEGRFRIVNAAAKATFNKVSQSAVVTLSTDSEAEMVVTPAGTFDDITYVNLNVYPQDASEGRYLHQGGHQSGAGTSGNVVGWYSTYSASEGPKASEWLFIPVSDQEAQAIIEAYAPFENIEKMKNEYKSMKTDALAKLEIARDIQKSIDMEHPLITDANQLSSPASDSQEGQNLEYLLDGDPNTFWHSDWHNEYDGDHYLQVELKDNTDANAVMRFTRRGNAWNNITGWAVYGTDDPDALQDGCYHLADLSTPYKDASETITTDIFPLGNYKYIRFYFTANQHNKKYAHFGEFQMFPAEIYQSATCQYNVMGALATNLEAVLDAQADLEIDDLTEELFNELKTAYDAFIAKFVDPTALREALRSAQSTASAVVTGTNPGYWSSENTSGNFQSLYNEAKAYDESGDYTPEQSQQYIDRLNSEKENVFASAIGIKPNKWYRFRIATEEEYDQYGWNKSGAQASINSETGVINQPELFGKYFVPATSTGNAEEGYDVETVDNTDMALGDRLYFTSLDMLRDEEQALFRFVAVGDSAYMLQNKVTGLFLKAAGTSGSVTLSVHPSLFNVRAIGYGQNVVAAKSITGENQNYLHAQRDFSTLVTWEAHSTGSNSALFIEEVADVASDYEGTDFQMPLLLGSVNTFCFPVSVSVKAGQNTTMWGVASLEDTKVTLAKIEGSAIGGRPFILVYGDTEEYDALEENDLVTLSHGYDIAVTPQDAYAFKGTYTSKVVGAGVIVADGNALVISKKSSTRVAANSAYISHKEPFTDLTATLEVIFDATLPDGIQTALQSVSHSGAVYTIDGRMISERATLNDLHKFGKGLYILNGTKVVVK